MFYKKLLLLLLPLVILIASVNFITDPAHLFTGGQYEKQISRILLKGHNVTNITNFDERLFQQFFISGLAKTPDNVVLGSSRSMLINSTFFNNACTINSSVSGGTLKDYLAIYNLYRSNNLKPKHLYIGIDPWLLNENNGDNRWKSIAPQYFQMLEILHLEKQATRDYFYPILKWKEILSLTYFQASLKSIPQKALRPCKNKLNNGMTRLTDGSITYDKKTRESDLDHTILNAYDFTKNNKLDYLEDYQILSNTDMLIFKLFITYLKKENIHITLVFAPYHPIVYNYILGNQKYHRVLEAETKFKCFAIKNNLDIVGSFDPAKCKNITARDFFDGIHLKEEGVKKLFLN